MTTVTVNVEGEIIEVPLGTSLLEITRMMSLENKTKPIVAAQVNNYITDLCYKVKSSVQVKFFDLTSEEGNRVYLQSLCFLFIRATKEILPGSQVRVEHSLAKGLYCEVYGNPLTNNMVKAIENKMQEIVAADEPFEKIELSKEEASKIFAQEGQSDKVDILKYLTTPTGAIYKSGSSYGLFYGNLVPSSGYLYLFKLQFHLPGVIIQYPLPQAPTVIPPYIPQPKLARAFYESERWAEIMEVDTVADLNELVTNGEISMLIKVAEALHEKKIANIADEITSHKERGNIILIAGPSSSGKTTFAHRLMVQLMVNGLKPITISVDDYFVNREQTPRDQQGNYDFEALEAIDTELFNDHLTKLILGEEVEIPSFNFKKGSREYKGHKLQIRPDQPIIIEGIHGLNEKLTYSIPQDHKFKIYISALTQLNIDNHTRIPTTDARKIRRMVRDHQFRGTRAEGTLRIWPSVRRGEDKNIFPFQEDADIIFNSALIYELAVLKLYAEPLLQAIAPDQAEYVEAQRLLRFLSYFLTIDAKEIPSNSILKEFIG